MTGDGGRSSGATPRHGEGPGRRAPPPVPPLPSPGARGDVPVGLWAGRLTTDPTAWLPTAGRVRRWCYAAAGDPSRAVGAAVVDLGFVAVTFVWAELGGRTLTWQRRLPFGRGAEVGAIPADGARATGRFGHVELGADGAIDLDVAGDHGRLRAQVAVIAEVEPAVLVTPTAGGGWNVTQKAAGTSVGGTIRLDAGVPHPLAAGAGGWRDWTSGRQDRVTTWRWVAGAGRTEDGRQVGLNASTGMNRAASGEDVVWWDGQPYGLAVSALAPLDPAVPEGRWQVCGDRWALELEPAGVRARDERLPLVTSRYVQPIGTLVGTLPAPDGSLARVRLAGVTEDHHARW